ncbi:MAG: hypothetical protein EAX86_04750 [Candidatus Heimdallarchaeota archaeon]|nr:hypothetical protein [Candidatus Heimdallarchaeota archaeon]
MNLEKYWELLREMFRLFDAKKYTEILEYLQTPRVKFPYGKAALFYSGICAAANLGDSQLAIKLLKQIIDEGGWYSEYILTQSPSLHSLQGIPEFKEQLKRSREISTPELMKEQEIKIIPEEKNFPYSLMLALHADSGVIEEEIHYWCPVVDKGFIVAMPRSTNVYWSGKDSAYWPDHESATKQLKTYVKKIEETYSIEFGHSLVGGLSSGAELAIWLVVSGTLPIQKFVAVAPGGRWMNDLDNWKPLIENDNASEVSGMIITGKKDQVISHKNIQKFVQMLRNDGISCQLIEYPNLGHWYPPDFSEKLLSFMNS